MICSLEELDVAYSWVCKLRLEYSPHNDIWNLRRHWETLKENLLMDINSGTYQFSTIDVYEIDDALISLWSSQDMIVLKLITNALFCHVSPHLPPTCYHVKGRGGLKKAVRDTAQEVFSYKNPLRMEEHSAQNHGKDHYAESSYHYIFRSDVKSYYDSIDFEVLMAIIKKYVSDPILITLLKKAMVRTETKGGLYTFFEFKGLPMGSPLSPLLGAIALLPLDQAMGSIKDIFYARYMDDWVVLTKTKTALRKVIKKTHHIMKDLKLHLHPTKTYIGKISHGFNFLGYYMDDKTLLPSSETIRRMSERATALYEHGAQKGNRRRSVHPRDISEYHANEPKPFDSEWAARLAVIQERAKNKPNICVSLRRYVTRWGRWLMLGLGKIDHHFEASLRRCLPQLISLVRPATAVCLFRPHTAHYIK